MILLRCPTFFSLRISARSLLQVLLMYVCMYMCIYMSSCSCFSFMRPLLRLSGSTGNAILTSACSQCFFYIHMYVLLVIACPRHFFGLVHPPSSGPSRNPSRKESVSVLTPTHPPPYSRYGTIDDNGIESP